LTVLVENCIGRSNADATQSSILNIAHSGHSIIRLRHFAEPTRLAGHKNWFHMDCFPFYMIIFIVNINAIMNDSYDRVSRSPLNCSPTKQLYSFPKANRFNYTSRP
jgi:hypothetical protein